MSTESTPTCREQIVKESLDIFKEIEGIFKKISQALRGVENDTVESNIKKEREFISKRIVSLVKGYVPSVETLGDTKRVLVNAQEDETILENIDQYLNMQLNAILPLVEGLLDYAQGNETVNYKKIDKNTSFLVSASTLMEVKGTLRTLFESGLGRVVTIDMSSQDLPLDLLANCDLFLRTGQSHEVLEGKKFHQPLVNHEGFNGDYVFSPEICICTYDELKTILEGRFFDDYLALGIKKRIIIRLS